MNLRLRIMPGSPAIRKLEDSFGASRFPPDHGIMAHPPQKIILTQKCAPFYVVSFRASSIPLPCSSPLYV
jgi:hypothetical protein